MRRRKLALLFSFLLFSLVIALGILKQPESPLPFKGIDGNFTVIKIVDGDTLDLSNSERVRLIGINTPERGEECYKEATEKLKEIALWREVELEKDVSEKDRYGRSLYYIYADGNFINLQMVRLGYALAYEYPPDVKYAAEIKDAENRAKVEKIGCLWKEA